MVKHNLANLKELHNPLKGKLSEVAEYFIEFYGEQYRDKILNKFNNVEFVFVDPVDGDGNTSFQIYFNSIRDKIFENLSLQFSTKGIKIADREEFLKNIGGVDRLSKTIQPNDCEQVINLLCAFDTRYMPENLQLLADKTVTPHDFTLLISEEQIKNDLLKFFSTVNSVYSVKFKENFEQLDADQKKLGFDKKVDYQSVADNYDTKLVNYLCEMVANQFIIPKTAENYLKIYNYITDYLAFLKGAELNDNNKKGFEEMFGAFYELSSNKAIHQSLKEQLDNSSLDFSASYFKSLREFYPVILEKFKKINQDKDMAVLEMFDDTKRVVQILKEKDFIFEGQLYDILNQYKFGRLDKEASVDSSGACIYTIEKDKPHAQKSFIVLNSYLLLKDRTLFHELNHALQIQTVSESEDSVVTKIGVPSAKITFTEDGKYKLTSTFKEKATMFNEVLNDYLTEKIFEPARGRMRVGSEVENEEGFYILAFLFLSKFFDKNLEVLKECAISDEPDSFLKHFDKKDLEKLIDLTDNLMNDIKTQPNDYAEFIRQKLLMDIESKRNIPLNELKEEDFVGEGPRKYVGYIREFDLLTEEIKPISQKESDNEKDDSDEIYNGRE